MKKFAAALIGIVLIALTALSVVLSVQAVRSRENGNIAVSFADGASAEDKFEIADILPGDVHTKTYSVDCGSREAELRIELTAEGKLASFLEVTVKVGGETLWSGNVAEGAAAVCRAKGKIVVDVSYGLPLAAGNAAQGAEADVTLGFTLTNKGN